MTNSEQTSQGERIVPMRLQKFLARAGVASRRGSENLMTAGRVRVNGAVTTELGSKVDPLVDVVTVDGREVRLADGSVYLMLYKPAGYVTTMRDPGGRRCVASLVPSDRYPGLFPVGRLDRDTTGLLLFTTDGEAAQALLHPSFEKKKHYLALVHGWLTHAEAKALEDGIELDDGPCAPARVEALRMGDPRAAIFADAPKGTSVVSRKVVVTTIVSSAMPDALANHYGFETRRVLTGFKNMGGQMDQLVEAGEGDRFLLGFEESYGYLVGLHARDKDAIVASMLTCEMAAWYAERGMDLYEAMEALYQQYGYYLNGVVNVSFPGAAGADKMAGIMSGLRENPPAQIAGMPVQGFVDYKADVTMTVAGGDGSCPEQLLPKSNVLEFQLGEGVKVIVRPSGTEPKIKAYLFSRGATREESQALNDKLAEAAKTSLLA